MKIVLISQKIEAAVVRNYSTGVYHLGYSPSRSLCGQSKKGSFASLKDCKNASESMFCKHCFGRKPETFFEVKA